MFRQLKADMLKCFFVISCSAVWLLPYCAQGMIVENFSNDSVQLVLDLGCDNRQLLQPIVLDHWSNVVYFPTPIKEGDIFCASIFPVKQPFLVKMAKLRYQDDCILSYQAENIVSACLYD